MKRYFVFLLCGLFLYPAVLFANVESDTLCLGKSLIYKKYSGSPNAIGLSNAQAAKPKRNFFKNMRYSGYARLFVFHRNMQEYYKEDVPGNGLSVPVNLTVGDGYQQPLLLFRMEGNPTAKTYFNMELQFDHRLLTRYTAGPFISDTMGRGASLYVIFKLEGAVETKIGKFKLTAGGGANWFRLSQSTLWGYQYRDDLFDRYPWEPEGHDFARYNSAYAVGDIPRDQRFGMAATQGFILEGTNLPAGLDIALLYGKTQSSGGFQSYLTQTPQNFVAGRLGKKLGDHKIGINYFNQFGYSANKVDYKMIVKGADSFYVENNRTSTLIASLDGRFEFKKFNVYAELGGGSFLSSTYNDGLKSNAKPGIDHVSRYKRDWSEMLFLEIETKKELTLLPIKLSFYRIGRYIVNNASSISNTSVESAKFNPADPDRYYTNYFDGMVTDIGQLANNRQGINLFTNKDFGKLKARFGLGIAQELKNLVGDLRNGGRGRAVAGAAADSNTLVPYTNSITFEHRLNGVTRSRFGFYERFTGPYGRTHSIFRHAYDNIAITDTIVNYKKSFSTAQLDLKYKFRLFGKELLMTNFVNYSSVQEDWSPIPVFSDKAFLRYFYEEFMAFYAIHPKLTVVGFWGMERVLGNSRTELADANGNLITDGNGRPVADPKGKAIDQTGYGYGVGIDYNFHSSASLNVRQRWFSHSDKNFTRDRFSGNEMTIEFKVFF
ncbi:MAG: hypothetical protein JWM14_1646 [Chitinophagaceae bacterium]|nr:hypothetical protein [Chitinophagaceae bacterium]